MGRRVIIFGLTGAISIGLLGLILDTICGQPSANVWGTCLGAYMAWWMFFWPLILFIGDDDESV